MCYKSLSAPGLQSLLPSSKHIDVLCSDKVFIFGVASGCVLMSAHCVYLLAFHAQYTFLLYTGELLAVVVLGAHRRLNLCVRVCREQTRPLASLGAQSPFPVVHCDKFPCQILPAPLYF